MFEYRDERHGVVQVVGFNLRYYKAFQGWKSIREQREIKRKSTRKFAEDDLDVVSLAEEVWQEQQA